MIETSQKKKKNHRIHQIYFYLLMIVLLLLLLTDYNRLMEDNIEDIGQISQLIINEIDIPKKTCFIGNILIREWSK